MLRVLLSLIALSTGATVAACEQPKLVVLPDEKDIGDDVPVVLIATQDYVDGMKRYVDCIQASLAAAGGDTAPPLLKTMLALRNNAAVDEAKAIVSLFTERVGPIETLQLTEFVRSGEEECVNTLHTTGQGVINERTVLLLEQDGSGHLNLLAKKCPSLVLNHAFGAQPGARGVGGGLLVAGDRTLPLLGTRLCSNGFIFAYDSAPCPLGPWFRVSKDQVAKLGVNNATPGRDREPAKRDK